jgi:hypothetical protein
MPLGLFIVLPEEDEDFPHILDLFRAGRPQISFTSGKAFRPEDRGRLELVRTRLERSALGRSQHE